MSRVAKNPVKLPAGVEVKLVGQQLSVKGAKGTLDLNIHSSVEIVEESGELRFAARNGDQQTRAMAGTTRALVNNMVQGVSQGFERRAAGFGNEVLPRSGHLHVLRHGEH
ncbi:50S ribosomal protein L6, partial [Pseudomonas sp. NPDC078416]|uniref:50S ribosomal protein L6 n=1 Tax=Pseudomonas sp. NPDC078416 TaxID=3390637 RepID=UPI003D08A24B